MTPVGRGETRVLWKSHVKKCFWQQCLFVALCQLIFHFKIWIESNFVSVSGPLCCCRSLQYLTFSPCLSPPSSIMARQQRNLQKYVLLALKSESQSSELLDYLDSGTLNMQWYWSISKQMKRRWLRNEVNDSKEPPAIQPFSVPMRIDWSLSVDQ